MGVTLTVFFEEPFWVGLVEKTDERNRLTVAKVVFGAEPSEKQLHEWVLQSWHTLRFSPPVAGARRAALADNPKRRQRQAAKAVQTGTGTKAQEAMKLMHEQNKLERKQRGKAQREADERRLFELRQQKKKEKHSGH